MPYALEYVHTVAERTRVQGWTASARTANEHSLRLGVATSVWVNDGLERTSRPMIFRIVHPTNR